MYRVTLAVLIAMLFMCAIVGVGCAQQPAAKTQQEKFSSQINKGVDISDQTNVPQDTADIDQMDAALYQRLKKESGKTDAEVFELMGLNYFKQDNSQKAILFLQRAVALDSNLFGAWYTLGLLMVNSPQSYAFFQKAIEANPEYAPAYYWMGVSLFNNRSYNEAAIFFTRYIDIAKDNPDEAERYKNAQKIVGQMKSSL